LQLWRAARNTEISFIEVKERRTTHPFQTFFYLLVALVGNLVSCLRTKSETESVTPDTAFRFNSKDKAIHARVHVYTT
jgi:hypothetical protein